MAVLVEAWEVIARRTAVEEKYPGGVAGWCSGAPNRTACADRSLCRVGFMHERDAAEHLAQLERLGLRGQEGGAYHEVAIVSTNGVWRHECSWLTVGRHATLTAAWLTASAPDPIVVPLSWTPTGRIFHLSAEESARRLKFLRRQGDVEVYLDTETGKELYRGRTRPPSKVDEEFDRRLSETFESIKQFMSWNGHPQKLGWFARWRLRRGIRKLEALTAADSEAWRAWWLLGMALRAASEPEAAYQALKRAYDANPGHRDVAREYGGQCLALGKGEEAVAVSRRTCEEYPDDAGLRSNLALALLVAGNVKQAKKEVARARGMDPADEITAALAGMIDEVATGKRERPKSYP